MAQVGRAERQPVGGGVGRPQPPRALVRHGDASHLEALLPLEPKE